MGNDNWGGGWMYDIGRYKPQPRKIDIIPKMKRLELLIHLKHFQNLIQFQ